MPEHHEPDESRSGAPWECEIGSFACLHFLRRIAASVALGQPLPAPTADRPTEDPVVEAYYAACHPDSLLPPLRTQRTPAPAARPESPTAPFQAMRGPGFEHLIWHCDYGGYYLPVPFEWVLVLPKHPYWEDWGPRIGSSHTLLSECEELARVLDIPEELDVEALRQDPDPNATGWRRYAIEAFMCRALIEGCRISIASGCALAFR